jgi:hypothetical protein
MADIGCLGVKHAFARPDLTEGEFAEVMDRFSGNQQLIECKPAFAVRLLVGAYEYGISLGFKPDADYFAAMEIFGDVSGENGAPDEPIEYGRGGKPFYVAGPYDNAELMVNRLTRKLGEDGFDFIIPAFEEDMDDAEYSDDLWDEPEE